MITKAGKLVLQRQMEKTNTYLGVTNEKVPIFGPSGTEKYFTGNKNGFWENSSRNIKTSTGNNSGIYIGSGVGELSENDHDLFERIVVSPAFTSTVIASFSSTNEKFIMEEVFTLTNQSDQSYTITEIGSVLTQYTANNPDQASADSNNLLLEHSLLDDPLTLAAGETGVIQWRREFDFSDFITQD